MNKFLAYFVALCLVAMALAFCGCQPPAQDQSAVVQNAIDELDAKYNQTHSELTALQNRLDHEHSVVVSPEVTQRFDALDKALAEKQSCPVCEVTKADFDKLQAQIDELRPKGLKPKADKHETCPPPETTTAVGPPELAPRITRADGSHGWPEDFDAMEAKAVELNRPMLIVFSTTACVHCQQRLADVYNQQEVGLKLFREFVPVYVSVRARGSDEYKLADRFGVNKFQYPAVVIRWPGTKDYTLFRPASEPGPFMRQVDANIPGTDEPRRRRILP